MALTALAAGPRRSGAITAPKTGVRLAYFYKPPLDGTPARFLASHDDLIILTHADEPYMAELRRAGYQGPILQYIAANETEGPGPYANAQAVCDFAYPTYQRTVADRDGVFCAEIHPHESWFLHNLQGERLWSRYQSANGVWRTTYLMNPGSSGWRQYLLCRLRQYRSLGFDGFFFDNVDLSRDGVLQQPESRGGVAEFPDDASYRAAEIGYLAAVRAAFPHLPLWANLTHDPQQAGNWRPYLSSLDGVMVEDFALGWKTYLLPTPGRIAQMHNILATLRQGKGVIAVEQGGPATAAANRSRLEFGLACYWALAEALPDSNAKADGSVPSGLYFRYADADEEAYRTVSWYPQYAFQPPTPTSALIEDSNNAAVWRRSFPDGMLRLDFALGAVQLPPAWQKAWHAP